MSTQKQIFVAYYRVSTKRQGRSGLGIDAQTATVRMFVEACHGRLVGEFTEHESGKNSARPYLQQALATCRLHGAILIVAKLDRLARNAAFLLSLRDASVEILACDMPSMNRMTVGIMAVVAEEEARMISDRTRVALAAAKRRGVVLGRPENLTDVARIAGRVASVRARKNAAARRARDIAPILGQLHGAGNTSLTQMANELNARGIRTARGCKWTAAAVLRDINRAAEMERPLRLSHEPLVPR